MVPAAVFIALANTLLAVIASRRNISREMIEDAIVNSIGGWDAFHEALIGYFPGTYLGDPSASEGEQLWIEITQRVGRQDVAHAQAVAERTIAFLTYQAELAPFADPCLEQMRRETPDIGPALECLRLAPERLQAARTAAAGGAVLSQSVAGVPMWMWIVAGGVVVAFLVWRK